MQSFLTALAVAFAAFCVWLTVRIVNRRERWAKWNLSGVVFGMPVLYVVSFGPACWISPRGDVQDFEFSVARFYRPLVVGASAGMSPDSSFVEYALYWYANLAAGDHDNPVMRMEMTLSVFDRPPTGLGLHAFDPQLRLCDSDQSDSSGLGNFDNRSAHPVFESIDRDIRNDFERRRKKDREDTRHSGH
jgi:hypothetical protein